MPAYIIADVEVQDLEAYTAYTKTVIPTIEEFGGRFVVRGGDAQNLEGEWQPKRVVVLEFATMEQAKAWWNSDIYEEPKRMRQSAAHTNMIVVDGAS